MYANYPLFANLHKQIELLWWDPDQRPRNVPRTSFHCFLHIHNIEYIHSFAIKVVAFDRFSSNLVCKFLSVAARTYTLAKESNCINPLLRFGWGEGFPQFRISGPLCLFFSFCKIDYFFTDILSSLLWFSNSCGSIIVLKKMCFGRHSSS